MKESYIKYLDGFAADKVIVVKNVFDDHSLKILKNFKHLDQSKFKGFRNDLLDYTDMNYTNSKVSTFMTMKLLNTNCIDEIFKFFKVDYDVHFVGRVYRTNDIHNRLDWHNDISQHKFAVNRVFGCSIYLDETPEMNTFFQMSNVGDQEIQLTLKHQEQGDITLFKLSPKLLHRVWSDTDKFERNTISGWCLRK